MRSFGQASGNMVSVEEAGINTPIVGWIEFQKPAKPNPDPASEQDWQTVQKIPMRSWLGNYVKFIGAFFKGFSKVGGKDIDGNDFTMTISASFRVDVKAASNDFQYGVLIGEDSGSISPWSDMNYVLGSILDSADSISCAATQVLPVTGDATETVDYFTSGEVLYLEAYRIFTNDGNSDKVIREVGLGAKYTDGTTTKYVLWERTVLDVSEQYTLTQGDSVKVKYTLQFNAST